MNYTRDGRRRGDFVAGIDYAVMEACLKALRDDGYTLSSDVSTAVAATRAPEPPSVAS